LPPCFLCSTCHIVPPPPQNQTLNLCQTPPTPAPPPPTLDLVVFIFPNCFDPLFPLFYVSPAFFLPQFDYFRSCVRFSGPFFSIILLWFVVLVDPRHSFDGTHSHRFLVLPIPCLSFPGYQTVRTSQAKFVVLTWLPPPPLVRCPFVF